MWKHFPLCLFHNDYSLEFDNFLYTNMSCISFLLNHLDRSSFMEYICYKVWGFPSCLSRHTEPPVLQTWVWLSCNSTNLSHLVLYLTGGFSETLHTMKYVKDCTFSSIWFAIYSMFLSVHSSLHSPHLFQKRQRRRLQPTFSVEVFLQRQPH